MTRPEPSAPGAWVAGIRDPGPPLAGLRDMGSPLAGLEDMGPPLASAQDLGHRPPGPPVAGAPDRPAGGGGDRRTSVGQWASRAGGRPALSRIRARLGRRRVILAIGVVLVLCAGLVLGWTSPHPPPEPTVQAFLLAWENGQYRAAAALTTGNPKVVAGELAGAYQQLGAADLGLGIASISQQASTASATFNASVDLGRGGLPWDYRGRFTLRRTGAGWRVVWSPAVIVPGLHAGQRLAVLTTMPPRSQLLDTAGRPLAQPSVAYAAGVRPGALRNPTATADALAELTGLAAGQILAQINAAPSASFLTLVHLRPAAYRRLSHRLRKIPGLRVRQTRTRLFDSIAPAISGSVGTETAQVLRTTGVPYRPGTTVGLSGLQQAFQHTLAGTPTTKIVVQNAAGHQAAVLKQWPGHGGTAVRTTIDSATQRAADSALSSLPQSAAIVAVRAGTGQILAVAQHTVHGIPAVSPLSGRYRPAQAFTILSTAALLATGFRASAPTPCTLTNLVGGQVFSNEPPQPGLGQALYSTDFAHACGTAFTGAALNLSAAQLTAAASRFGIGAPWQLPLPSFSGTVRSPTDQAQLAAEFIGTGGVLVSPLDMALAAGAVQSGSWHPPSLIARATDPEPSPRVPFGSGVLAQLRSLMRDAVRTGAGKAADVAGAGVYGQVGSVPLRTGPDGLQSSWFVGFRGDVAFAVLLAGKSPGVSAAPVAGQFVLGLQSGS